MTKEERDKKFAQILEDDELDGAAGGTAREVTDDLVFMQRKVGKNSPNDDALKANFAEYGIDYTPNMKGGANKYLFKYNGKQYSLTQAKAHRVIELIEADKNKGNDW